MSGPARGATRLGAALVLGLCLAPLQAQDDGLRQQVEQKLRLVSRLISDSPAAQRIATSGQAQAVAHLDEGRVHHALATDLLARGDVAGARRAVDDALRHLGQARRLVPDAPARQALARQRHEQLAGSVERLIEAWRLRLDGSARDDGGDMTAAVGLAALARQQAQEGRHDEANQSLAQAERHVLAGMGRTLSSTTLDYTVRAGSPAEEFQIELARHRGLVELVPLAVRDLKPAPDAMLLIDRYGETGGTLQTQALQQFQAGDTRQALTLLRNATLYVQRALLAAGLTVPQPTGSPP